MRKHLIKGVSWLMLVVFFLGVAPKEYLHDVLFHHKDTVHPHYKKDEFVIGNKHIHCAFLGFAFAPYIATEKQDISFKEVTVHAEQYVLPVYCFSYSSEHQVATLRGPPHNICCS